MEYLHILLELYTRSETSNISTHLPRQHPFLLEYRQHLQGRNLDFVLSHAFVHLEKRLAQRALALAWFQNALAFLEHGQFGDLLT